MPPLTFGTEWRHVGIHRRYGHDLPLWLAEPTQAYIDAYKTLRGALIGAGFSWTDRGHKGSHLLPCWWDTGISIDAAALQEQVDSVIAAAATARDEKHRAYEERVAREVAEIAPAAAVIRGHLDALIADRPWALGRHLGEARELLAMESWTRHGLACADRHLDRARGNIERAAEHLGRIPPAQWFARADDADVRAAALSACRILSALDTDWASERNGVGWSQASAWTGHTLAECEALDQGEAAHALALLFGHRRQLPDELNVLLFGVAPARRRRPTPADAPALAL